MSSANPLPIGSRGLFMLLTAAAAAGYLLSGTQAVLSGCNPDASHVEESGQVADSRVPEAPEAPATCSDQQASGAMRDAADAWDACRWADALALYDARDPAALPSEVEACASERTAAMNPVAADLTDLQGLLDRQRCHAAKARVAELAFAPSDACSAVLDACEADEHSAIVAELAQSERALEGRLVDGKLITDVAFRRVDSQGWLNDIVVVGLWDGIHMFGSQDEEHALMAAAVLARVTNAIGEESAKTRWSSRIVILENPDGGCYRRMSTATARAIARKFRQAKGNTAQTMEVLAWATSKLDPC